MNLGQKQVRLGHWQLGQFAAGCVERKRIDLPTALWVPCPWVLYFPSEVKISDENFLEVRFSSVSRFRQGCLKFKKSFKDCPKVPDLCGLFGTALRVLHS